MGIRINCKYNDQGAWCFNKNIKRSLLGLGARCCIIYPNWNGYCEYQEKYARPKAPPSPQGRKNGSNKGSKGMYA